jgi:hypothetical protein
MPKMDKGFPFCAMKAYRGVEVQLHSLLNSALDKGELTSHPTHFTPWKEPWYLNSSVFWVVTQCRFVKNQCFVAIYQSHLRG